MEWRKRVIRVLICLAFLVGMITFVWLRVPRGQETSSNPKKFKKAFTRVINAKKYKDFLSTVAVGSFDVPGLSNTRTLRVNRRKDGTPNKMPGKAANCRDMVPQGICTTEDYILITAYCSKDKHCPVLYVVDKKEQVLLKTIALEDLKRAGNHVGGIAYDNRGYVWIAHSVTGRIGAIPIRDIREKVAMPEKTLYQTYSFKTLCTDENGKKIRAASFITFYQDRLWVGHCETKSEKEAFLYGYRVRYDKGVPVGLTFMEDWPVPAHANGASFAQKRNDTYLLVTCQQGRKKDSHLEVYKVKDKGKKCDYKKVGGLLLPPMLEEICINNEKIYSIYESAAKKYSGNAFYKASSIVNRVCIGSVDKVLSFLNR